MLAAGQIVAKPLSFLRKNMSFWSSQRIKLEQAALTLLEPFDPSRVKQGAYEMSLSQDAIATTAGDESTGIPGHPAILKIAPGQFGILYSAEKVHVPTSVIAFISVKSAFKDKGLINISGFHVDPGFLGRLKFSVYNAGNQPVFLRFGEPTFQIWFSDLDGVTEDPYDGKHQGQSGLTLADFERNRDAPASPASLNQRLLELERNWAGLITLRNYVLLPLVVSIIAGLVLFLLTNLKGCTGVAPSTTNIQASPSSSAIPKVP